MSIFIPVQIHPLFIATLALMAGIVSATGIYLAWLIVLSVVTMLSLIFVADRSAIPIVFISFVLGALSGHIQFNITPLSPLGDAPGTLIGTIEEIHDRYTFAAQQELVVSLTDRRIKLLLDTPAPILIGDTISIAKTRGSRKQFENSGNSMIRTTYLQKIFGKRAHLSLIARPSWHVAREIDSFHRRLLKHLSKKLDDQTFKFFCLMFLGKFDQQQRFEADTLPLETKLHSAAFQGRHWFNNWGISHHLARSGLHVVIVMILLQTLLHLIPLHYLLKRIIVGCYLALYALLSWPTVSFTRAILMVALAFGADFAARPYLGIHMVTMATYIVLLFQPSNLFYADFQLSFGLTLALAWANHVGKQRKILHTWQTIAPQGQNHLR